MSDSNVHELPDGRLFLHVGGMNEPMEVTREQADQAIANGATQSRAIDTFDPALIAMQPSEWASLSEDRKRHYAELYARSGTSS